MADSQTCREVSCCWGPLLLNAVEEYNIELNSCVACESQQFFKQVFYLKDINFMMGGPLASGSPGQLPPWRPPLIRPWSAQPTT